MNIVDFTPESICRHMCNILTTTAANRSEFLKKKDPVIHEQPILVEVIQKDGGSMIEIKQKGMHLFCFEINHESG